MQHVFLRDFACCFASSIQHIDNNPAGLSSACSPQDWPAELLAHTMGREEERLIRPPMGEAVKGDPFLLTVEPGSGSLTSFTSARPTALSNWTEGRASGGSPQRSFAEPTSRFPVAAEATRLQQRTSPRLDDKSPFLSDPVQPAALSATQTSRLIPQDLSHDFQLSKPDSLHQGYPTLFRGLRVKVRLHVSTHGLIFEENVFHALSQAGIDVGATAAAVVPSTGRLHYR